MSTSTHSKSETSPITTIDLTGVDLTETETPTITTTVLHDPNADAETTEDPTPLVGKELLDLVNTSGDDISREDLIKAAGYTKVAKDGTVRLMYAMFMEALLEAQGTKLGAKSSPSKTGSRMGHPLSYATRVHFNGNIMVGKAYVAMLPEHNKGKEFKVVVNPETNPGGINLVPVQD